MGPPSYCWTGAPQSLATPLPVYFDYRECTRSSATAEKQRVNCACLSRLANWLCNALNNVDITQDAVLSQVGQRDAAVNFGTYRRLQRIVHFNHPTPCWRQLCEKRFRISRNNLYCQNLDSLHTFLLPTILLYVYYFSRSYSSKLNMLTWKQSLKWNGHSRSFKVIYFASYSRQGVACHHIILLALSLKFSHLNLQNSLFDNPAVVWRPRVYPHTPYISRKSLAYIFAENGSIFIQIFAVGSKIRIFSHRVRIGRSRWSS